MSFVLRVKSVLIPHLVVADRLVQVLVVEEGVLQSVHTEGGHDNWCAEFASDHCLRHQHRVTFVQILLNLLVTENVVRSVLIELFRPLLDLAEIFTHEEFLIVESDHLIADE